MYVGLHSLHKISKYKGKDGVPPVVNKLGGDAWNKLKQKTKSRVKDIARELIALYARRKKEAALLFLKIVICRKKWKCRLCHDETPDQIKAIEAVKADMEKPQVMDRLICGDVGFGKTEVAIRAAFKAVADSKQVGCPGADDCFGLSALPYFFQAAGRHALSGGIYQPDEETRRN